VLFSYSKLYWGEWIHVTDLGHWSLRPVYMEFWF